MPDSAFDDPRLAVLYDPLDPDRTDLEVYAAIVEEFGARRVLDVGCGTGTFGCLLASRDVEVVGVDPAAASVDIARRKPYADRVNWVNGEATNLPPTLRVDMATMTANVAQVFLTEEHWRSTLRAMRNVLRPGGRLVFETRDPARQAWLEWNRERSETESDVAGVGRVRHWLELTDVDGELVSFRSVYVFASDGKTLTSDSTLRFRSRSEMAESLRASGFVVDEVRDAPDRPGRELVFVASRPASER